VAVENESVEVDDYLLQRSVTEKWTQCINMLFYYWIGRSLT